MRERSCENGCTAAEGRAGEKSRKEPTSRGKARKLFYERVDEPGLLPLGLRRCNSVGYRTLVKISRKENVLYYVFAIRDRTLRSRDR